MPAPERRSSTRAGRLGLGGLNLWFRSISAHTVTGTQICLHLTSTGEAYDQTSATSLSEATMFVVELFGSWEGRIGRLTYALASLGMTVVYAIAVTLMLKIATPWIAVISIGLLTLPMIYSQFVLALKRAHDLNRGAGWIAILYGLSLVTGAMQGLASTAPGLAMVGFLIALPGALFNLWQVIQLLFFAGTPGSNGFGPPPRLVQSLLGDSDGDSVRPMAAARTMTTRLPIIAATSPVAPRSTMPKAPTAAPRGLHAAHASGRITAGFGRRGLA